MLMLMPLTWPEMDEWLLRALAEDIGAGDVTTESIVELEAGAAIEFVCKSALVACGLFAAARVFELLDPAAEINLQVPEGRRCEPGEVILRMAGNARAVLSGERLALNLVQRLSGIATLTAAYVEAVAGTKAKIAATRKTTPLMRRLEKNAVTVGGGVPHRFGLDDGVLIKDNHIAVAGSIKEAVRRAARSHHLLKIEVEVSNMEEAEEAVAEGAELLLLDNMTPERMKEAVERFEGLVILEASGNVTLANVGEVARSGVDIISSGSLTHSAPAADVSARVIPARTI